MQTGILRAADLKPERDFTLAFNGTFLEGLEIAFIVVTFGSAQGNLSLAATGAALALVVMGASARSCGRRSAGCPRTR